MATINKRKKSWELSWYENGSRHRQSLGQIQKAEAERIKAQKEFDLGNPSIKSPYFDYYAAEYLEWYEVNYPASFDRCKQIIVNHLSPQFGQFMLCKINGKLVKNYQLSRQSVAVSTYLKEIRCLNAMLNRAVEWELIEKNPIKHIKPPKDTNSKPPDFFTVEELKRIYQLDNKYRWQWQFIANTGLRLSEALRLDLDKDIKRDCVYVLSTAEQRTKSAKWREIPLFDGARIALEHIHESKLFSAHSKSVSRAFRLDAQAAKVRGSFHSLRHTFISHLAMSGEFSMTEIQAWAGHSSITTTQKYQHLVPNYRIVNSGAIKL